MAELNANEKKIADAVVQSLTNDADLKAIFCRCWPCFKSLLELLAARLPALKFAIDALIKIGDLAHSRICG
jgi:hypothetical protein